LHYIFCFVLFFVVALCVGFVASGGEAQFLLSTNACLELNSGSSLTVASFYALDSNAPLNATVVCDATFFGVRFENVSGLTFATRSNCHIGPGGLLVTGPRLENISVEISSAAVVAGPVRIVAWEAARRINATVTGAGTTIATIECSPHGVAGFNATVGALAADVGAFGVVVAPFAAGGAAQSILVAVLDGATVTCGVAGTTASTPFRKVGVGLVGIALGDNVMNATGLQVVLQNAVLNASGGMISGSADTPFALVAGAGVAMGAASTVTSPTVVVENSTVTVAQCTATLVVGGAGVVALGTLQLVNPFVSVLNSAVLVPNMTSPTLMVLSSGAAIVGAGVATMNVAELDGVIASVSASHIRTTLASYHAHFVGCFGILAYGTPVPNPDGGVAVFAADNVCNAVITILYIAQSVGAQSVGGIGVVCIGNWPTVVAANMAVAVAGGNTTVVAVLSTCDCYNGMAGAVGFMLEGMSVANISVSVSRRHNATIDLSGSKFHAIVGAEGVALYGVTAASVNVDVSSAFRTVVMNATWYAVVVLATGVAADQSTISNVQVASHGGAISTTATVSNVGALVGGLGVTSWNSSLKTVDLFGDDGLQTTTSMSGAGTGSGIVGGNGFAGSQSGSILSEQLSYTFCSSHVTFQSNISGTTVTDGVVLVSGANITGTTTPVNSCNILAFDDPAVVVPSVSVDLPAPFTGVCPPPTSSATVSITSIKSASRPSLSRGHIKTSTQSDTTTAARTMTESASRPSLSRGHAGTPSVTRSDTETVTESASHSSLSFGEAGTGSRTASRGCARATSLTRSRESLSRSSPSRLRTKTPTATTREMNSTTHTESLQPRTSLLPLPPSVATLLSTPVFTALAVWLRLARRSPFLRRLSTRFCVPADTTRRIRDGKYDGGGGRRVPARIEANCRARHVFSQRIWPVARDRCGAYGVGNPRAGESEQIAAGERPDPHCAELPKGHGTGRYGALLRVTGHWWRRARLTRQGK